MQRSIRRTVNAYELILNVLSLHFETPLRKKKLQNPRETLNMTNFQVKQKSTILDVLAADENCLKFIFQITVILQTINFFELNDQVVLKTKKS